MLCNVLMEMLLIRVWSSSIVWSNAACCYTRWNFMLTFTPVLLPFDSGSCWHSSFHNWVIMGVQWMICWCLFVQPGWYLGCRHLTVRRCFLSVRASPAVLSKNIECRKVKMCWFGSPKWFRFSRICRGWGAWWKPQQCCAPAKKSVINLIWLLFSVF